MFTTNALFKIDQENHSWSSGVLKEKRTILGPAGDPERRRLPESCGELPLAYVKIHGLIPAFFLKRIVLFSKKNCTFFRDCTFVSNTFKFRSNNHQLTKLSTNDYLDICRSFVFVDNCLNKDNKLWAFL